MSHPSLSLLAAKAFLIATLCEGFVMVPGSAEAAGWKKPGCTAGGSLQHQAAQNKYRCKSRLEPNLAHLASILASQMRPKWVSKRTPKRSKNHVEF